MKRVLVALVIALLSAAIGYFFGYARGSDRDSTAEQAALKEEFTRSMSGVALDGTFTVEGQEEPRSERYVIEKVERVAGDYWVFHARIQYGDTDVSLPVPVRLLWAGDTPLISLTDVTLPGLGTFTARVAFYRDRYAGFWSNGEIGGHQFGKLIPATD